MFGQIDQTIWNRSMANWWAHHHFLAWPSHSFPIPSHLYRMLTNYEIETVNDLKFRVYCHTHAQHYEINVEICRIIGSFDLFIQSINNRRYCHSKHHELNKNILFIYSHWSRGYYFIVDFLLLVHVWGNKWNSNSIHIDLLCASAIISPCVFDLSNSKANISNDVFIWIECFCVSLWSLYIYIVWIGESFTIKMWGKKIFVFLRKRCWV